MITVNETRVVDWRPGITIADLLKEINDPWLYDAVKVNGQWIASPDFQTTEIPDEADIMLIPFISGG